MIGNRKLVVTTHMDLDNFHNVPMICKDATIGINNGWLPKNLSIGKLYYFLSKEGNLVAFKIHAYTFVRSTYSSNLYGLIQTPTETSWRNDVFDGLIFENVEDYYTYLESGKGNIRIKKQPFNEKGNDNDTSFHLYKTYYWRKAYQRPQVTNTRMWRILITETHIYVEVDYTHAQYGTRENGFSSAEECIKYNIDGMKIMDFGDPKVIVNIQIEEPKTPKVRVIKFIED